MAALKSGAKGFDTSLPGIPHAFVDLPHSTPEGWESGGLLRGFPSLSKPYLPVKHLGDSGVPKSYLERGKRSIAYSYRLPERATDTQVWVSPNLQTEQTSVTLKRHRDGPHENRNNYTLELCSTL